MKRGEVIARLTANERKLYAIARAMMGNEQDALDMISETACRAWRKAGSIREEEAVDGWLAVTLINCCKSALRRRKPQAGIDPEALRRGGWLSTAVSLPHPLHRGSVPSGRRDDAELRARV